MHGATYIYIYIERETDRAASKARPGFDDMHSRLATQARECSNLANAFSSMIPPGWDSPALCSDLHFTSRFQGLKYAPRVSLPCLEFCMSGGPKDVLLLSRRGLLMSYLCPSMIPGCLSLILNSLCLV